MNPQQTPPAVNGSAGAVDLGALKAKQAQLEALEAQRDQLTAQLLTQAGLMCPCGERIRAVPTVYFTVVEGEFPGPQGPVPGLNILTHTCCSRECQIAATLEGQAIARRDGPAGRVTWLDELRAARAAAGRIN